MKIVELVWERMRVYVYVCVCGGGSFSFHFLPIEMIEWIICKDQHPEKMQDTVSYCKERAFKQM